jgi:molybdopterin-biosynthesis enzyme MoeA-like protein
MRRIRTTSISPSSGDVIVMAGVPSIMQAMLDEVAPKVKIGIRILSETVRADVRESDISTQLGEIAKATRRHTRPDRSQAYDRE